MIIASIDAIGFTQQSLKTKHKNSCIYLSYGTISSPLWKKFWLQNKFELSSDIIRLSALCIFEKKETECSPDNEELYLNTQHIRCCWRQLMDDFVANPVIDVQRQISKAISILKPGLIIEPCLATKEFIMYDDPRVYRQYGNNCCAISWHYHAAVLILCCISYVKITTH